MTDLTTAELLLEWDRRRARSKQKELGMSEVGGCERRAGYRLAGVEPTNAGGSVQAVMGTAVHAAVENVFHDLQAEGLIPADDLVEHEVRFAGVLGHLDRYVAETAEVKDTKTTSGLWLDQIKVNGAGRAHLWQVHLYGAGLVKAGHPVRRVTIDYIARDTGADHRESMPFDTQHVRDAVAWLDGVRSTPLEMLNRDYAPDSSFCRSCPFQLTCWEGGVPNRDPRSVMFVDNPDGAMWAEKLDAARKDKADAEKREKEAKGALDAIRPNEFGRSSVIDVGYPKGLEWSVTTDRRVDTDSVRAEYAEVGARPPEKVTSKTTLKLVAIPKASS